MYWNLFAMHGPMNFKCSRDVINTSNMYWIKSAFGWNVKEEFDKQAARCASNTTHVYLKRALRVWLRAGRFGNRIPVGARFSAPVQTGPGTHPASCRMGTWSFPGVKSCRGVTLTPHLLLVPGSRKGRAIP